MKNNFIFYTDYAEFLEELPREEVGDLMFALIAYQQDGTLPDFKKGSGLSMAFKFIKSKMDRDNSKYEEICEQRKAVGKKGGRPKKSEVEEDIQEPCEDEQECFEDNLALSEKPKGFEKKQKVSEKPKGFEKKQKVSEKPKGFEKKQKVREKPDKDNDNDKDTDKDKDTFTPNTRMRAKASPEEMATKYCDNPPLVNAMAEFIRYRKELRKPMTDEAVRLMYMKLDELTQSTDEKITILQQSIREGWSGVYALGGDRAGRGNIMPGGHTSTAEQLEESYRMMADWSGGADKPDGS
jgi:hypothetical protein